MYSNSLHVWFCCTHQHYHRQWLPNTDWSNSTRSAWARNTQL